jgi:ribosome-associated protein
MTTLSEASHLVPYVHMEDLHIGSFTIPAEELEETFETSGGPGGQHAHRSATAVRLRLEIAASSLPGEVRARLRERIGEYVEVVAADSRSQFRNRALARQRLREKIEKALVEPPKRRRTRPTRASKRRRLESKRARAETKRLRKRPDPEG